MPEPAPAAASGPSPGQDERALRAEIVRLNKIIRALMNRVEHSTSMGGSDFDLFQTAIVLEEQVRRRTEDLEAALREVQVLQVQLREQAIRDPLTGLYNRRYLDETLGRELVRAERHDYPVGVIMGDIDRFKTVNDSYGHPAGDEVLRVFGGLLKHSARGSDICCRYGGEEFLLVLFDATLEDTLKRAEQLRAAFAATSVTCETYVIRATASFGVAVFPEHGRTGETLIAAADAALYVAKDAGRDQVKRYGAPMK
jgi:diguanylate cyclase (GGDEF)-like protein